MIFPVHNDFVEKIHVLCSSDSQGGNSLSPKCSPLLQSSKYFLNNVAWVTFARLFLPDTSNVLGKKVDYNFRKICIRFFYEILIRWRVVLFFTFFYFRQVRKVGVWSMSKEAASFYNNINSYYNKKKRCLPNEGNSPYES